MLALNRLMLSCLRYEVKNSNYRIIDELSGLPRLLENPLEQIFMYWYIATTVLLGNKKPIVLSCNR